MIIVVALFFSPITVIVRSGLVAPFARRRRVVVSIVRAASMMILTVVVVVVVAVGAWLNASREYVVAVLFVVYRVYD